MRVARRARAAAAVAAGATATAVTLASAVPQAASAAPTPAPGQVTEQELAESVHDIDLDGSVHPIDPRRSVVDLRTQTSSGGTVAVTINSDVLFAFGSANLTPLAQAQVDAIAGKAASSHGPVTVEGFTDSVGTPTYNRGLSQRRADAVAARLRARAPGLPVSATGFGEARPLAPNQTPDGQDNPSGRALNRRVTITYRSG